MIFFLSLPIASSSVPEPTIQIMSFLEKNSENKNIEIPGNLSANKKSKIWFLFLKKSSPVHCPSISSIQGSSILSSETKSDHDFLKTIFSFFFIKYSATVCCTKGFLLIQRAALSYFCPPQDTHNILMLRKSRTTFCKKTYIDLLKETFFLKKMQKKGPIRTYLISCSSGKAQQHFSLGSSQDAHIKPSSENAEKFKIMCMSITLYDIYVHCPETSHKKLLMNLLPQNSHIQEGNQSM